MSFFSIIIPTYNCEQTISRCLESVIAQKFKDFELIIADGSSTDQTGNMVRKLLGNNSQIHSVFFSEKDNGVYDAMNKGASRASGQWLYFLGADDLLLDDAVLHRIHKRLSEAGTIDFLYGNVLLNSSGESYNGKFSLQNLLKANICHQAIFVRKQTFFEMGSFNLRYPLWADWDFNLKIFLSKKLVYYTDLHIALYNNSGKSSGSSDRVFYARLAEIKREYYSSLKNRLNSRVYHWKKKLLRKIPRSRVA